MSTDRRVLVVGATGTAGEPVARAFADRGWQVRVLSTRPDVARDRFPAPFEVFGGDVTNRADMEHACEGCYGVHLSLPAGAPDATETAEASGARIAAAAAVAAGVKRLSLISGSTVSDEKTHPYVRFKREAESAIATSGIPYTIFRSSWLMESLFRFISNNKAHILGKFRHPWHWIAGRDYGRMVAVSYELDSAPNKPLTIFGPEPLTLPDALELYRLKVEPELEIKRIPLWQVKVLATISRRATLKRIIPFMKYMGNTPDLGDPAEANALLGAPTIRFVEWCEEKRKGKRRET
jgi:uncharacterized protein YbjT (DUF2867 family)